MMLVIIMALLVRAMGQWPDENFRKGEFGYGQQSNSRVDLLDDIGSGYLGQSRTGQFSNSMESPVDNFRHEQWDSLRSAPPFENRFQGEFRNLMPHNKVGIFVPGGYASGRQESLELLGSETNDTSIGQSDKSVDSMDDLIGNSLLSILGDNIQDVIKVDQKDILEEYQSGNRKSPQSGNFGSGQQFNVINGQANNSENDKNGNYGSGQQINMMNGQTNSSGSGQSGNFGNGQQINIKNGESDNSGNSKNGNSGSGQNGNFGSGQQINIKNGQSGSENGQTGNFGEGQQINIINAPSGDSGNGQKIIIDNRKVGIGNDQSGNLIEGQQINIINRQPGIVKSKQGKLVELNQPRDQPDNKSGLRALPMPVPKQSYRAAVVGDQFSDSDYRYWETLQPTHTPSNARNLEGANNAQFHCPDGEKPAECCYSVCPDSQPNGALEWVNLPPGSSSCSDGSYPVRRCDSICKGVTSLWPMAYEDALHCNVIMDNLMFG